MYFFIHHSVEGVSGVLLAISAASNLIYDPIVGTAKLSYGDRGAKVQFHLK